MKKNNFLVALVLCLAVVVITPSCKKYDEGPRFSLRSKKARVANKWKLDAASFNGTAITGSDLDAAKQDFGTLELTKDGDVKDETGAKQGTWAFADNKEDLKITDTDGTVSDLKILKLKEKELWLKSTDDSGDTIEFHLIPA